MANRKSLAAPMRWSCGALAVLVLCGWSAGCTSNPPKAAKRPEPEVKERLEKLYRLYRTYCERNHTAPTGEQALKDFYQKQSPEETKALNLGDDIDELFVSPRDGQKFEVAWGVVPEPTQNRAIIWEKTGKDGMHYVALSRAEVVPWSEDELNRHKQ
jgi:hypothetical protein